MKAYQLYNLVFTINNLKKIFEDKISLSSAVGRDGIKRGTFSEIIGNEINIIISKTYSNNYNFTGYKEKLISKGADSAPRQISIPTIRDRLTLRAICNIVSDVFEECKTRPPHEFIKNIKKIVFQLDGSYSFLRIDIMNYYPSIDQDILLRRIRRKIRKDQILTIIEKAIKTPTGKKNIPKNENKKGVPQGLSISNILSSIYLHHVDKKYRNKYHYFRYVDDILIICKSAEAKGIHDELRKYISISSKLECHGLDEKLSGKTKIEKISDGIDYLGFHITNKTIAVRRSSYKRMFNNIIRVFTQFKYLKDKEVLIWRLNLKISGCVFGGKRLGWMYFFSQTENTSQLKRLDAFVKNTARKHNLESDIHRIKTFIRTYHEIRYNGDETRYIPDFDNYSIEQMKDILRLLTDKKAPEIESWDILYIEEQFRRLTGKEVAQLEKDLLEVFS